MKNFILLALACIALVISSCNQNSPAPAPATPAPAPTPTPTSSMTATEAALVGDWIFDKEENYISGNLYTTITTSNATYANGAVYTSTLYASSHMILKSTLFNATVSPPPMRQFYNADYFCSISFSAFWQVNPSANGEKLFIGGGSAFFPAANSLDADSYIITLNATTLITQEWNVGSIPNGDKTYYHK